MDDCKECNTHDAMYETGSGKYRCYKCGHTEKRTNNIRERPNRPNNADCGDIIVRDEVSGETEIIAHRGMCKDRSSCSAMAKGIKKIDGNYVVVCSRHRKVN